MTGPLPAVARTRLAVRRALERHPDLGLAEGGRVIVALSGGPDSLALAAAVAFEAPRLGFGAGAVIVDHGLVPSSSGVAQRAARQAREMRLDPVEVVRVDVGARGGPEAAAREARLAAIEAARLRQGASAALFGHTRDDQAETVLLGLARGSGPRAIAGMLAVDGSTVRPFLDLPRSDTQAACEALGLEPWHDPTNSPEVGQAGAPKRSRLRTEAMPVLVDVLGPGVGAALARTAAQLRELVEAMDQLSAEALDRARVSGPGEMSASAPVVALDCATLSRLPDGVRRPTLRLAALRAGATAGSLSAAHVVALDDLVSRWRGQGEVCLPGGFVGRRECGTLVFLPATPSAR